MTIRQIKIENFHCFRETKFDFARQTSVFIGKNGTGKSSLIKAICDSLSFIFSKSTASWGFSSLANEVSDLGVENINVREIYHNGKIADYVSIQAEADLPADVRESSEKNGGGSKLCIKWDFRKNSYEKSTIQSSLYKEAYIKLRKNLEITDRLPLLVYYSDRYPHVNTTLGSNVKAMLNKDDSFSRTWGYYHWNDFTSCTEIWQKRFIRISNKLIQIERSLTETDDDKAISLLRKQKEEILHEIDYVSGFLKNFSDNEIAGLSDSSGDFKISAVSVDGATDFYIKFTFSDGVQRAWHELPAGLERLFSIVFDMAYRSYILNKGMAIPHGIVLIDEIDLHLHPSLQQDVLLRFTNTFPEVQFIVATHSPLVVTNLRQDSDNKVFNMERQGRDYTHTPTGNLFLHDYVYTLYEIMKTEPRNFVINSLSERYFRFRRRGKKEEAELVLNQLRQLVGENDHPKLLKQLEEDYAKG